MNQLDQFHQILSKEMNRKEFLQHIGMFIFGVLGISALMKHFFSLSGYQHDRPSQTSQANGYGARSYGR